MVTREPPSYPSPRSWVGGLGREILRVCQNVGRAVLLLAQAALSARFALTRRARHEIARQMFFSGIRSVGIVTVVATFTGMVLTLQTGLALRDYGEAVNLGAVVTISMFREMGPFMTGLILAASVGSAIAAQMGTMVVQDEVVALEMMAIDPVRFLVMPRMVALAIVTPLLGFYCCVMGILGGGIVAQTQLHIAWEAYWDGASRWVQNKDISVGLLKSFIFGVIITITACHQGFLSQQGAVGVAHATRRTVVISFLLVLVVGYFVTRVFYV